MSRRPSTRPRRLARRGRAPWRAWLPLLAILGLLLLAPALAHAQGAAPDSVTLRWTAVGDDSLSGTAAAYDLRMAGTPITLSTWSEATVVSGLPVPLASGTGMPAPPCASCWVASSRPCGRTRASSRSSCSWWAGGCS